MVGQIIKITTDSMYGLKSSGGIQPGRVRIKWDSDPCRLDRTTRDHRPALTSRYARRIEGNHIAGFKKYAAPLEVEMYRAVRSHRRFQSAAVTMMWPRRFARFGVFDEVMALEARYHTAIDDGEAVWLHIWSTEQIAALTP